MKFRLRYSEACPCYNEYQGMCITADVGSRIVQVAVVLIHISVSERYKYCCLKYN